MLKNYFFTSLVFLSTPFAIADQSNQLIPVQKGTTSSSNLNMPQSLEDLNKAVVQKKVDEASQQISVQSHMQSRNAPENPRVDRVIKRDEIEEDHRKMLWQDKTVDKNGYLRVESTVEYINLPTVFLKHPKFAKNTKSKNSVSTTDEIEAIGSLEEDQHRTSYAFRHGKKNVIFTVWNYREDGATYTISEEFLNQKVSNIPAVLSLSTAENSKEALWKLTWWNEGVMFELYVSDILDSDGTPRSKPDQIIHIADGLMKRLNK